ncbi:Piso0_002295 [Millerozyma farinosa CBS 7064]|uniref:Piso0_002295 protein n=1 Tax=Pichia sorbitophila (strain ATCC MYA-4447 / BCRC 22081 / CBS 7064 / NBRC 10061 / NRRL Y-12695) TaxID=559304 RepID=G8YC84_PICSO|nr:Piso0_002295 [Millerozyma farinosa CBS 7064]
MPRKKSAAKRAKEEVEKAGQAVVPSEKEKSNYIVNEEENDDDSAYESSSSVEEDEYGDLITDEIEDGIQKVMNALKSDPKSLLKSDTNFFKSPDEIDEKTINSSKEKPMYLKDYHRMNILSGGYLDEENENGTVDGEKSFVATQREERNNLIDEINKQFSQEEEEQDDDDDDGLIKKKEPNSNTEDNSAMTLPDPEKNQDEFLKAFLDNKAWIPRKNDKEINLDQIDKQDEEAFDDAVEKFEHAYNFRFEDPTAAEIVSYARNQATLRRSATSSRKRQREKKLENKAKEEQEKNELLKKKKTAKINTVVDRLGKIKEAVGDDIDDAKIKEVFGDALLDEDFDDADWDEKMSRIFDESYYDVDGEKPEWNDELINNTSNQKEGDQGAVDQTLENDDEQDDAKNETPSGTSDSKPSKKDKLKEKKMAKKKKESLKEMAESLVESNASKIIDEVEEERSRGRSENEDVKFKYREVSPESFGLTTRDILFADDKDLNRFIGIKKMAPYREKNLLLKDKRKYTKKKRLEQWRKEAFNDKNGSQNHSRSDTSSRRHKRQKNA